MNEGRAHDAVLRAMKRRYVVNEDGFAHDPVSLDLVPRKQHIVLNTKSYDRRGLQKWMDARHLTVPHSRRELTSREISKIYQVWYIDASYIVSLVKAAEKQWDAGLLTRPRWKYTVAEGILRIGPSEDDVAYTIVIQPDDHPGIAVILNSDGSFINHKNPRLTAWGFNYMINDLETIDRVWHVSGRDGGYRIHRDTSV